MSGVIIKCPKCGRGHMRIPGDMMVGSNTLKNIKLFENDPVVDTKQCVIKTRFLICSRCGYISR